MMRRSCQILRALALGICWVGHATADTQNTGLQPYQMVRSLQLVQDRIASGDHASLPMQKKLLELIDLRLRTAGEEEFKDSRNVQALMIYAMSGGNPSTVATSLARPELPDADRDAGAGILAYLVGDVNQARAALDSIDPAKYPDEISAFLSLIKGSVLASEEYDAAISHLDRARLLGPGTLIEEAALRRTVSLAVAKRDATRFLAVSEQYARRFLRSPYAAQFAEAFIASVVELRSELDLNGLDQTIAWMTGEQARTIYLRLARRAAIDGDKQLLAYASKRASEYPPSEAESDPRAELYSSISTVTSDAVTETLNRLEGLDGSGLTQKDRALLKAAKTVANEVVAPVKPTALPAFEQPEAEDAPEDTSGIVETTRARLQAIDKLLEETAQ